MTLSATPPQADGYVTEIAYLPGYYRELNPSLLTLALNRQGVNAWQRGTPFTYLELGSGYTLSTLIHAAGHPEGQFIAVDVLPDHIMTARSIAEGAKLDNLKLIEGSFADLDKMSLPKCDFIAMHGVWSWINDANRAHILRCIDVCLKPGGVLFLSYNALPGCAAVLPMRELMVTHFAAASGPLPERMASAIALADSFKSTRAGFFANNPMALKRFEDLKGQPRNYLAHEYFNADWTTFYHEEVAAHLRPLGLKFVTLAPIFDTLEDFHYSAPARELLEQTTDPTLRETLKDFMVDRQFRIDVLVRDGAVSANADDLVNTTRFTAVAQPDDVARLTRRTTLGDISPPRAPSMAVLAALDGKPSTLVELTQHPSLRGAPIHKLARVVSALVGLGAIDVAAEPLGDEKRADAVRRLNDVLRERNRGGMWAQVNASVTTGGGIHVSREDQMFFLAGAEEDPVAAAARLLAEPDDAVRPRYQTFIGQRLPVFARRGVD